MKSLAIVFLVIIGSIELSRTAQFEHQTEQTLIGPSIAQLEVETPSDSNLCTNIYGPKCLNCYTILTCANQTINSQPCTSIDRSTPYCEGNACTETSSDSKCPKKQNFRCTAKGRFPNPDDCRTYYSCPSRASERAVLLRCSKGQIFDSKAGQCKQAELPDDCKTISCTDRWNRYQIFEADKSILAYCADTDAHIGTILFRCSDPSNMEYDSRTLKCKFICRTEGNFPDPKDCRKFHRCQWNGQYLEAIQFTCPNEYKYDITINGCKRLEVDELCFAEL